MVKPLPEGDTLDCRERLTLDFDLSKFEPAAVGFAARKLKVELQDRGIAKPVSSSLSGKLHRFLLKERVDAPGPIIVRPCDADGHVAILGQTTPLTSEFGSPFMAQIGGAYVIETRL